MLIDITNAPKGSARGAIAELAVEALLLAHGWNVGRMNEGCVYDLLAERSSSVKGTWAIESNPYNISKTFRIQVKLAYPRSDYVLKRGSRAGEQRMRFDSTPSHRRGERKYAEDDFDYFAIVIARENAILFIPWTGQFQSMRVVTDEMMAEYQELPR